MSISSDQESRAIAQLRIVAFALAAGLVLFLILAAVFAPIGGEEIESQARLFTGVAFLLGAGHVVGYVLVRKGVISRVRQVGRSDEPEARAARVQAYHAVVLIGCALAEGAGMVATVFYLLTGSPAPTAVSVLAVAAIAVQFPSVAKLEAFEAQLR